jgi:hypothetical protein
MWFDHTSPRERRGFLHAAPIERITMIFEEDTLVIEVAMYCLALPNHCPLAKYGPID